MKTMTGDEIAQAIGRAHQAIGDAAPPRPLRSTEPVDERDLWQQFAAQLAPAGLAVIQCEDTHNVAEVVRRWRGARRVVARLCYIPHRNAVVFDLV